MMFWYASKDIFRLVYVLSILGHLIASDFLPKQDKEW